MQSGQSCVIAEVLPLAPSSATRRITQTTVIEVEDEASTPLIRRSLTLTPS